MINVGSDWLIILSKAVVVDFVLYFFDIPKNKMEIDIQHKYEPPRNLFVW